MTPLDVLRIIVSPWIGDSVQSPDLVLLALYMLLSLLPTYAMYVVVMRAVSLWLQQREHSGSKQSTMETVDGKDERRKIENITKILLLIALLPIYFMFFILFVSLLPVTPILIGLDYLELSSVLSVIVNKYGAPIALALFSTTITAITLAVWALSVLGVTTAIDVFRQIWEQFGPTILTLFVAFAFLPYFIYFVHSTLFLFLPGGVLYYLFFVLGVLFYFVLTARVVIFLQTQLIRFEKPFLHGVSAFLRIILSKIKIVNCSNMLCKYRFVKIIFCGFYNRLRTFVVKLGSVFSPDLGQNAGSVYMFVLINLLLLGATYFFSLKSSLELPVSMYFMISSYDRSSVVLVPAGGAALLIESNPVGRQMLVDYKYGSTPSFKILCDVNGAFDINAYIFTLRGWWPVTSIKKEIEKYCTQNAKQTSKTSLNPTLASSSTPFSVPTASSSWGRTTVTISSPSPYFTRTTWLPFRLETLNPNLLQRILITSLPDRLRSNFDRAIKYLAPQNTRVLLFLFGKLLEVKFKSLLKFFIASSGVFRVITPV